MNCGRYEPHKFYGPRIFLKSLLLKKDTLPDLSKIHDKLGFLTLDDQFFPVFFENFIICIVFI